MNKSNSPGLRSFWTSIAAPMMLRVNSLLFIKVYFNTEYTEGTEELRDGDFFVGAEDFAEGVADFADRGVGFYGVEEEGH